MLNPFIVDSSLPAGIILNATGLTALAQEIRTVMTTRKGSLPLDRDFGIDYSVIDAPINTAMPVYVAEISRQIEKYVPRVKVLGISFAEADCAETADGIVRPIARVEVRREYVNDFR